MVLFPNHAADVDSLLSTVRRGVVGLPAAFANMIRGELSPAAVVLPLVEVCDGALVKVGGAVGVEVGGGVRRQVAVEDLALAHGAPDDQESGSHNSKGMVKPN